MMKDFDRWNIQKKHLEGINRPLFSYHEREIWWCALGINLGDEQDGKHELFERPVLVIKKFNNKIALVIPMTTKIKKNRFVFPISGPSLKTESYLIFSQIRLLSTKRFRRRIGRTSSVQFNTIKNKLVEVLFL